MNPQDFLDQIVPAARSVMRETGIPASFTLAQAILESGWGASKLAKQAFNLFNIKADRSWRGPTISMPSVEFINGKNVVVPAVWREYGSWRECLKDRSDFFKNNKRYAACFKETTGPDWCHAVQAAGYATDPNYAALLIDVIDGRNLTRYDNLKDCP